MAASVLGLAGCDDGGGDMRQTSQADGGSAEASLPPLVLPTPGLSDRAFAEPRVEEPEAPAFKLDKSVQVSILCYHRLSTDGKATDMVIPVEDFREQMQRLKESNVTVVGMDDFLAWKRGEKNLPDPSVLITFDDGWESVYTQAFPVLREHGFPFTFFLYTNYLESGGRSLSVAQVKEMLAHGGALGCHSRSHPYGAEVKRRLAEDAEKGMAFLREEMVKTADRLEKVVGVRPKVYAYPGGYYSEEMHPLAGEAGYEACFTVNPAKITWQTPVLEVHRYVVYGNHPSTFAAATTFRGIPLGRRLMAPDGSPLELDMSPADGEVTTDRRPRLAVNLGPVPDLDPESLVMRVSGVGEVPAVFDEETRVLSYELPHALRVDECAVFVYWKRVGEENYDAPLLWKFKVDRLGALLQSVPPPPEDAPRPPPITAAGGPGGSRPGA